MRDLNKRIRGLLEESGNTQKSMSIATGIAPATINAWFVRDASISAEFIPKVAAYLGVTTDYLLTGSTTVDSDTSVGKRKLCQLYDTLQPMFRTQLISFGEGLAAAQSSIEGNTDK